MDIMRIDCSEFSLFILETREELKEAMEKQPKGIFRIIFHSIPASTMGFFLSFSWYISYHAFLLHEKMKG
jgi:hypothetical protein